MALRGGCHRLEFAVVAPLPLSYIERYTTLSGPWKKRYISTPLTLRKAVTARAEFCLTDFGGLVVGPEDGTADEVLVAGEASACVVLALLPAKVAPTLAPTTTATNKRPRTRHIMRCRRVLGTRLINIPVDLGVDPVPSTFDLAVSRGIYGLGLPSPYANFSWNGGLWYSRADSGGATSKPAGS